MEGGFVTEIPSYLKQLARLISYAFYQIEDTLIVDMLVRHPCMKEKDMEELLKFDLKLLRARMATLKSEKFVQLRLRMETGADGKAQKVNYYFINYKSLVNVIKYKLDHMRKKMETQERDATNRASFKCTNCEKSFTDLEAGELYDPMTDQFQCTFCKQLVEEDESAGPKTDSRLMVARFNEQMEMIYDLLKKAEDIKLAPELLEPEPPRNANDLANGDEHNKKNGMDRGNWSGEATRLRGINDQTRVDIRIGDAAVAKPAQEMRERPIWLVESTIGHYGESSSNSSRLLSSESTSTSSVDRMPREDIMSVLLTYEQKDTQAQIPNEDSDAEDPDTVDPMFGSNHLSSNGYSNNYNQHDSAMELDGDVDVIESEDDDQVTLVQVGDDRIPIAEVTEDVIERMTPEEKETYIQQYQEFYSYIYD